MKLMMQAADEIIPVHYIGQIQSYLTSLKIDTVAWLAQAGLSISDVIEDQKLLTFEAYQNLILAALKISQQADMGLYVGRRLSINSHGALGFALLSCQTIRQVLSVFQRYVMTRTPLVAVEFSESHDVLIVSMLERMNLTRIRPCFFEVLMVTVVNILQTVLADPNLVKQLNMPFTKPKYVARYSDFFNCTIQFCQPEAQLVLNKALLDEPLIHADPQAFYHAKKLCEDELRKVESQQSLAGQVRTLLLNSREHFLDLSQISQALHVSPRTLHRRLAQQETCYQQILDEVRSTLAKQYLALHGQSVKQVAYNLGYCDVANFRRAFKRWYGCAPNQFKQVNNSTQVVE